MKLFDLRTYIEHKFWIGVFAIFVSTLAWSVELNGMVYVCPYCRAQRTVIGLLGLALVVPFNTHWIVKYLGLVIGFFGAVVAANQHFMGWKKISAGTFSFNENIAIDPFVLSGLAMMFIIGLVFLLLAPTKLLANS